LLKQFRFNHIIYTLFYLQAILTAGSLKVIPVKIFISPAGRLEFITHGTTIEEMVAKTTTALEMALNVYLLKLMPPMKVKYVPTFETETPLNVDLDRCDTNLMEITDMLNLFNIDDSRTSEIIFLNCKGMAYIETFRKMGLRVPYITQSLSTQCTTRTAIFIETEKPKFLSVFSTALVKAAGIPSLNPLSFEEVGSGDNGVKYEIRVSNDTVTAFKDNACFYTGDVVS
jgi:hypothetical protein